MLGRLSSGTMIAGETRGLARMRAGLAAMQARGAGIARPCSLALLLAPCGGVQGLLELSGLLWLEREKPSG